MHNDGGQGRDLSQQDERFLLAPDKLEGGPLEQDKLGAPLHIGGDRLEGDTGKRGARSAIPG